MFYSVSQFQKCGDLNETQLRTLNLTMSVSGGVGTLITLFIVAVLVCARAYKTILQRLFVYSVLATLLHEVVHVAQIEVQFQYKWQTQVCTHLGFLSNWSGWVIYVFNLDIILYLLLVVYQQLRGDILPLTCKSNCCKRLTEFVCVLASIFLPVAVIWVPYKEHEYGLNEAYCYIRAFDDNCTETSVSDKLIYTYSLYEAVGVLAVVIAVGILIIYCTLSAVFLNVKQMLQQITVLVLAIIIYIVILNIMLAVDISLNASYSLNVFFAIAATLTDLIFLFGYLFAFYSGKLRRKIMPRKKHRVPPVYFNDQEDSKEYGTFEESNQGTSPSSTYFDVLYTGEFTSVSSVSN